MKYGRYDSALLIRIDTKLKEQVRLLAYASKMSLAGFTRAMLSALVQGQFKALSEKRPVKKYPKYRAEKKDG